MSLGTGLLGETPSIRGTDVFDELKTVKLTDEDYADVKGIAVARLVAYKELTEDLQDNPYIDDVAGKGAEDIYTLGVEGEKVFSKAFGVNIDRKFTNSGDSNHDFVVNGVVIETKATRRSPPELLVRHDRIASGKYDEVNVFVLMWKLEDMKHAVVGYATYDEVVSKKPKMEPNDIINHIVPWDELHREPYSEL